MAANPSDLESNWLGALAVATVSAQHQALAGAGTESRAAALLTLREFPGIAIGELAAVLGLSHSACVRIIDGLTAGSLVDRARSGRDGRHAQLTLTAGGRRAAERLQSARLGALEGLLAPLSGEERRRFARLVERVLSEVTHERAVARRTCRYCAHRICAGSDCPIGSAVRDRVG